MNRGWEILAEPIGKMEMFLTGVTARVTAPYALT